MKKFLSCEYQLAEFRLLERGDYMLGFLNYEFMRRALVAAVAVSIMIPMVGVVLVLKRLSSTGEALSHTSLAGVIIGLIAGISPILSAMLVSLAASLLIEYVRRAFPRYAEISTNVVLSAGIGLAAVLSGFVGKASSLNSYLFGSLVSVSRSEIWLVIGLGVFVTALCLGMYKELLSVTLDEEAARLSGVPVRLVNTAFTVLTAIAVSAAARIVGALMVSSLIVLPVACAILVAKSYKMTLSISIAFAMFFSVAGLILSYHLDLQSGGTIVLLGVVTLFIMIPLKRKALKN